jgi:hypothetical protein
MRTPTIQKSDWDLKHRPQIAGSISGKRKARARRAHELIRKISGRHKLVLTANPKRPRPIITSIIEVAGEGEVVKESGPLGPQVGRQIGKMSQMVVSEGGGGAGVELLVGGFGWRRGKRGGSGGEAVEAWRGEEFAVAR